MDPDLLIELHPRLFHMAHHAAWPGIAKNGLLSTEALADMFEISGAERAAILDQRRHDSVHIEHHQHGTAVIRDNKPMTDSALQKCLTDGLSPTDWYRTLNGLVFFWTVQDRLDRLFAARAYRDSPHLVLEFDTAKMVEAHAPNVRLSPINSGSTVYNPVQRGDDTFRTIDSFPYKEWRAKGRGRRGAVVEFAVQHQVPDPMNFLVSAAVRHPDGTMVPIP